MWRNCQFTSTCPIDGIPAPQNLKGIGLNSGRGRWAEGLLLYQRSSIDQIENPGRQALVLVASTSFQFDVKVSHRPVVASAAEQRAINDCRSALRAVRGFLSHYQLGELSDIVMWPIFFTPSNRASAMGDYLIRTEWRVEP